MQHVRPCLGFLFVIMTACRRESSDAPPETPRETPLLAPATCSVPGVESAQRVQLVELARECSFTESGSWEAPQILRTAEELAAAIACTGATPPSIDMSAHDVYVVRYSMSPAFGGRETLDDGTVLTAITRFRNNCPDDPLPMPMDIVYAFIMPKGATRTYREATCTLPRRCP